MDLRAITSQAELEHILFDESLQPKALPLSLLKHITSGFADDNKIGYGGFALVYKGMLDNGTVAVKKLLKSVDTDEKKFTEEVRCLMKAKQKNIVRFLGYCYDIQGEMRDREGKLVMEEVRERLLCFEYLPNGSLDKQITDASCGHEWRHRYRIISGICDGLYYLHQKSIVHLDLKPANILLDDNMMPKITDFGLSRCFDENRSRSITSKLIGTQGYLAPEFYAGRITFKLDIYSLGIIIMEIITGQRGYTDIDIVVERWRSRLDKTHEDIQRVQLQVCTEIAIECTDSNPAKRPDMQHILDRLGTTKGMDESATEAWASSSSSVAQKMKNHFNGLEALKRNKSPNYLGKVISVVPSQELRFLFEPKKDISCCLQLINWAGASFIAFNINTDRKKYVAQPDRGTLAPCSKCDITLTLRAQEAAPSGMKCVDVAIVQARRVPEGFTSDKIDEDFLKKASLVDEVTLPIVYVALG